MEWGFGNVGVRPSAACCYSWCTCNVECNRPAELVQVHPRNGLNGIERVQGGRCARTITPWFSRPTLLEKIVTGSTQNHRESLVVAVVSVALAQSVINRGLLINFCWYGHKKTLFFIARIFREFFLLSEFSGKNNFLLCWFFYWEFFFLDFYGTLPYPPRLSRLCYHRGHWCKPRDLNPQPCISHLKILTVRLAHFTWYNRNTLYLSMWGLICTPYCIHTLYYLLCIILYYL